MVAVEHRLAVRDVGDREHDAAAALVAGIRERLELHADRDLGRQPLDGLDFHELRVVVAESVGRLDIHRHRIAGLLAIERRLQPRQHARMPAMQVRDWLVGGLEQRAVGIVELEGERHNGVGEDVHRRSRREGSAARTDGGQWSIASRRLVAIVASAARARPL
jgi:hypothetical protein